MKFSDAGEMMHDVAIIGAGPAGANLARLLGERYRVLLIDRRSLAAPADGFHGSGFQDSGQQTGQTGGFAPRPGKCCGGLLAPDAQKLIAKLGLGIPKDILVDPQLFAVRTIDLTNGLERMYQRFYFNMDREKFDRWLVSLVPPAVDKRFDCLCQGFSEVAGGYEIRYTRAGLAQTARARVLVGADGARSAVRRALGPAGGDPDLYVSIQEWFECRESIPYFTAVFDEAVSDFYAWVIPKDNCLLVGSALRPGGDAWARHGLLKEKLARMGFDLNHKIRTEGAHIYRPRRGSQLFLGRGRIALVGEAAGAISPSSAEGVSYALQSSLDLAQSLENGIDGFLERYMRQARGIRTNLLFKNLKAPAMYHPMLRKWIMRSGLNSIR